MKEQVNAGQELSTNSAKIAELTLELGEQRKVNEDLKFKMNELLSDFTQYRAGHLKNSIERDIERKKEDDRSMPPPSKKNRSPSWGKIRRDSTPSSSDWESKGDSSASCSDMDNGWGNYSQKSKARTRSSPPRDDWKNHRQRSPVNSRHSVRSQGAGKRQASPARNQPPSKKSSQRDEWMNGGKEATAKWTGYHAAKNKIRSFGLSDTQNLIARVKEADSDLKEIFYKCSIPYEQRATEELSKYLSLHKELGIPAYESKKRSVSLNFYYAKVLKMCHDHVNSLRSKDLTDQSMVDAFDNVIEHNKMEPNPYEHYEDSYALPSYICKLGEHSRERRDHKHAGFRLWLQDKDMLGYHQQRFEFYDRVFLKRDMKPVANFMSKEDYLEMNEELRKLKQTLGKESPKPPEIFKRLYAKVYKEHYTDIMEQIETFAAYGTPIQKHLNYENIDAVFYIDTGADTQGEF